MTYTIVARPLTATAFAPFGDVLEAAGNVDKLINVGMCRRFHDRARLSFDGGRPGISIFDAQPRTLPYDLDMMERHPLGSQCFVPMHGHAWLVTVAPDAGGVPGRPVAFVTHGQAANLHRGIWHGVLTPLAAKDGTESGVFAVVDRIANGPETEDANLQVHRFDTPWKIRAA